MASTPEDVGRNLLADAPGRNLLEAKESEPTVLEEMRRIIIGGIRDAGQQILEGTEGAARALESVLPLGSITTEGVTSEFVAAPDLPGVPEPSSTLGSMARDVTQFVTGFAPILRAANVAFRPASAAARLVTAEGAAIAAGQAVVSPHEERLSNLIQSYPVLQNPVTEFMAARPDDNQIEARLRMVLEDVALGAIANTFLESLRAIRGARRAKAAMVTGDPEQVARATPAEQSAESLIDLSTNVDQAKRAAQQRRPDMALDSNLNQERLATSQEVKNLLGDTSEANANFATARRGVQSHEETLKLAESMGFDADEFAALPNGTAFNAESALRARQEMVRSAENLVDLARKAKGGSDEQLVAYQEALTRHVALQERVSGITAEAGRALNQFRILAGSEGDARAQAVKAILETNGGRDGIERSAEALAKLDSPAEVAKYARDARQPKFFDKVMEVWINNLLSGPVTHAVNMTSNAITAVWTIPEHLLAAGIGAARRGKDKVFLGEVAERMYGMAEGARDGLRLASKAFFKGEVSDLMTKIETPHPTAIGGKLGTVLRTPTRALQAEDEFFKAIGYRMELRARALRSVRQKGLRGRAAAQEIQRVLRNPPTDLDLAAIDAARYQTFTRPTGPVAGSLQKVVNLHPWGRFIVPFIRTPSNILKFAAERTPLAFAMKDFKSAMKAGGAARDIAIARLSLGAGIGAGVMTMALEGGITGAGPTDPDLQSIKRESGWAPYSIRIGDQWVSFQRIEPAGIIFGISADLAEIVRYLGSEDPEVLEAFTMLHAAVANNLTSKTWLRGISDAINAYSDPGQFGSRWMKSLAGTIVPTGVAQIARSMDPVLRDTRDMTDKLLSRLPGYSKNVPARRNLFGEKIVLDGAVGPTLISPFYTNSTESHPVAQEMVRLELDISMPKRKIGGVELTSREYQEYVEMAGKPATAAVRKMMTSPTWARLQGTTGDMVKATIIRNIFKQHRDLARETMSTTVLKDRFIVKQRGRVGRNLLEIEEGENAR